MDEPPSYIFKDLLFVYLAQSPDSSFWALLAILCLLIIASGLVSASEISYFSLSASEKSAIEDYDDRSNLKYIKFLINNPQKLLATILISNNFINIAIVLISSTIIQTYLSFSHPYGRIIFELGVITSIILIFGEILPKVMASKNILQFAHLMARPIYLLFKLLSPFSSLLLVISGFIHKKFRKKGIKITKNELEKAINITEDIGTHQEEQKILEGIVKFGDISVKQVMKPRIDVAALDFNTPYDEVLDFIRDCGYSRIPVYKETFDNIVGVLYIKDLLPYLDQNKDFEWQKFLRQPFFVPENKKLDDLLRDFQKRKMHMAIVVDEFGAVPGIITLEDVLEEIVGEITDEYDDEEVFYSIIDDDTYIFEGKTPLKDFYRIMQIEDSENFEKHKGESETIGGFIMELMGKIPQKNEKITFDDYQFVIESADRKKIKSIKVIKLHNNQISSGNQE